MRKETIYYDIPAFAQVKKVKWLIFRNSIHSQGWLKQDNMQFYNNSLQI